MALLTLNSLLPTLKPSVKMPVLFIGHGSPMNAIEDNIFHRQWVSLGKELPKPSAILCISAHWLTHGTKITAMKMPRTIHDFSGFPEELFEQEYKAPGNPELAEGITRNILSPSISADLEWGLDHGAWSVLKPMFPAADIPVLQLSIDYYQLPQYHYQLAGQLKYLREKGVLIIGSGNIVHNLRALRFDQMKYDWAVEFDATLAQWIEDGNDNAVLDFQKLGKTAQLAHPSYDHLIPLFYILGLKDPDDRLAFFNEGFEFGSLSMKSVIFG